MLAGHDILCFAPSDWWAMNPSCTTHIMSRLARANRVLYINPFSSDLLGQAGSGRRRGLGVRIARKLRSLGRGVRKVQDNLHVFSPLFLPIQGRGLADRFSNLCLKSQIRGVARLLGFRRPLLWMENVRAADALEWFTPELTVYHVSDLFAADTYTSRRQAQQDRETRISRACDLLICVSRELYELKRGAQTNVHYVPHGVDFELFRQAAERRQTPAEIRNISRPIAGYFGTMTQYNDIEMMTYCARSLPGVSFVFAGQVTTGDYAPLRALPNVHLLGRLPYATIPHLAASFDVCLLQWKMSEWIRKCNPLKMLEYMASGNPIVSVAIDEARQYADVISIAASPEEFCRAIQWELQQDTPARRTKRIEIASRHSWAGQVEQISQLIEQTLGAQPAR